ncbi:MAG: hypothetical protein JNM20_09880 [Rhizobiales bacterium]|nr:hypothetical protein [Hyphomicrobiales bacterium]
MRYFIPMWGLSGFERKSDGLAPRSVYLARIARNVGIALVMTSVALVLGIVGFVLFAHLTPLDAFLNAAMLLSGMGPTEDYPGFAGKIFGGLYALFSGLFMLVVVGLVLTPVFHRMLHQFHLDEDDGGTDSGSQPPGRGA